MTFSLSTALRGVAIAEATRVARARTLWRGGDAHLLERKGPDVWIGRPRRWRLRASLRGRAILIWRVSSSDGCGRVADSVVMATTVQLSRRVPEVRKAIDILERVARPAIDAAAAAWWRDVQTVNGRVAAVRVNRERRLLARAASPPTPLYQPGLFDRRGDRLRRRQLLDAAEYESTAHARVAATAMWAAREPPRVELLLALIP